MRNLWLLREWASLNLPECQTFKNNQSAYSTKLLPHGINFYALFVPDLLHEFELGVWKSLFGHLLLILYAHDTTLLTALNRWWVPSRKADLNSFDFSYRETPTFGRETIRKIKKNVSKRSNLAARDYKDLLQCAIPAFDYLLPKEHDSIVKDLLFEMATWHSLAKLRLHTDTTLKFLRGSTKRLGKDLRAFRAQVCSAYDTRDLPAEETAHRRRKAKKKKIQSLASPARSTLRHIRSTLWDITKSVFGNMAQRIIILLKRCVLNARKVFSKHVD